MQKPKNPAKPKVSLLFSSFCLFPLYIQTSHCGKAPPACIHTKTDRASSSSARLKLAGKLAAGCPGQLIQACQHAFISCVVVILKKASLRSLRHYGGICRVIPVPAKCAYPRGLDVSNFQIGHDTYFLHLLICINININISINIIIIMPQFQNFSCRTSGKYMIYSLAVQSQP